VTVGPARAKEALHVAYAKGVDQAIHVVDETFRGTNAAFTVRAIAQVVKNTPCEFIFAGIQADDDLQGQFGIALAEHLGLPVVTAVTEIHAQASQRKATVVRELGGGYKEELEVDLPCVLTIQFGIRPLRYTPVMAIVRARAKKIQAIDAATLGVPAEAPDKAKAVRVLELFHPKDSGHCEFIEGAPPEMATGLVARLAKAGVL
jgi:electron transfer flavoprotein beta subunit